MGMPITTRGKSLSFRRLEMARLRDEYAARHAIDKPLANRALANRFGVGINRFFHWISDSALNNAAPWHVLDILRLEAFIEMRGGKGHLPSSTRTWKAPSRKIEFRRELATLVIALGGDRPAAIKAIVEKTGFDRNRIYRWFSKSDEVGCPWYLLDIIRLEKVASGILAKSECPSPRSVPEPTRQAGNRAISGNKVNRAQR